MIFSPAAPRAVVAGSQDPSCGHTKGPGFRQGCPSGQNQGKGCHLAAPAAHSSLASSQGCPGGWQALARGGASIARGASVCKFKVRLPSPRNTNTRLLPGGYATRAPPQTTRHGHASQNALE